MEIVEDKPDMVDFERLNSKLVHALKQLQLERIRTEIGLHQKIHDLQAEFDAKLLEFDRKRAKIISGEYVPTEKECVYEYADSEFPPPPEITKNGIVSFWPMIFHNLDMISEMIQEHDEPIINHLVDLRCEILKEPRGFKIEFEFNDNEYFEDKILTKEYYYSDKVDPFEPLQHEGLMISRAVGCKINWKPGKDVTTKKITKKMKHKSDNQVKTVEKTEKNDSFFNFFDVPTESIETVEEDARDLLMADFDIGETLRHSVIPRAVIYFTGEGIEDDEYDDDVDEEDFDDYDEDEELDEDEEEVAESKGSIKKGKSANSRGKDGGKKKKDVPPECKQQ
ncbi:hypothetical protein RDWZM_006123 [Blomia tropicalis]|uniref:Nucleosome assembly protein 1 n=1 Tax=Blomia tropicalis TaxID=40697 RepID=A0A9Q0RN26_BLOTA|nr:Nucleosome assembly protein 1-like 1 [Blomia tropicalis]KAJ6220311.1 hypothetical protein RDWZM_006123 [Blomia tropicalis]